jgi:hypothetical protein
MRALAGQRAGRRIPIVTLTAFLIAQPAYGQPDGRTDADVDQMVERLVEQLKARQITDPGPEYGSWQGYSRPPHEGGVTALVTFALLKAGVPWHDDVIKRAVDHLSEHPLPGTYSRSLRAAVWAHLSTHIGDPELKARFRRLLQADTDWLVKAMKTDGFYGYNLEGLGGDHSCSQFGVLGTWVAESAGAEVPLDYWERVSQHWRGHQLPDGSWGYTVGHKGTPTMTTAGINTLYITLAQLHARKEPPYVRLRGIGSGGPGSPEVAATIAAANRGLGWLSEHDVFANRGFRGYQLFGLERLAVISGLKYIGDVDWYREGVHRIQGEAKDNVHAAFQLLFLTYGRAPVLINKLRHGPGDDWNFYYRDLHFLTEWLSERQERIYKWQIVTADSPLHDLLDAPILLISGRDALKLNAEQRQRLLDYIDAGGTVVGHADRAGKRFTISFRRTFEGLMAGRELRFEPLRPDHPLFSAVYGRGEPGWAQQFGIEGLSDPGAAGRTCVFLFPRDVAGAWHQNRHVQHSDLFNLMVNLRVYCAPTYELLPKRLRPRAVESPAALPLGYLTISMLPAVEDRKAPVWGWSGFARRFADETGIEVVALSFPPAEAVDLIHLSGRQALQLSGDARQWISQRLRQGSFLLIESAGSRPAFSESARKDLAELAETLGGEVSALDAHHPIFTGRVPGGLVPGDFKPNRWGHTLLRGERPPIQVLTVDSKMVGVFVPFDLLATASGHFLYETAAYSRETSRALLANLLAWRYQLAVGNDKPFAHSPRPSTTRGIEPLLPLAQSTYDQQDFAATGRIIRLASKLAEDDARLAEWRARIQQTLTDAIRQARKERRLDDVQRLGRILVGLVPEVVTEDPMLIREALSQPELPAELGNIKVTFHDQETTALVLLHEWFKWRKQHDQVLSDLEVLLVRERALDDRAEELLRRHAADRSKRGRNERDPADRRKRYRSPEFEELAKQRRDLGAQVDQTHHLLNTLEDRMRQLTDALRPHAKELTPYGITLEDDDWVWNE